LLHGCHKNHIQKIKMIRKVVNSHRAKQKVNKSECVTGFV
jgi:hypothetical protein